MLSYGYESTCSIYYAVLLTLGLTYLLTISLEEGEVVYVDSVGAGLYSPFSSCMAEHITGNISLIISIAVVEISSITCRLIVPQRNKFSLNGLIQYMTFSWRSVRHSYHGHC